MRLARRWRLLLAHDVTASTCDPLIDAIEGALGNVDIYESASVDDARDVLRSSVADFDVPPHEGGRLSIPPAFAGHDGGARFDLCMICLDLPPAPTGGVRLAQEVRRQGLPVVLITRSLRWIPPAATALRELPWVPPDASQAEVARAVGEAMASFGVVADGSWAPALSARQAGGE